ncbi:putative SP-containing protein [Vairimorpha necatrix]|uniref:SP-containing protein n=1 Tax=Vairimorpha necatrix TaxID=6039 RepID=A0AAX4JC98_9MICR
MRYPFCVNIVLFMLNCIKSSIKIDESLKEAINSTTDVCEPLVKHFYENFSPDLKFHIFYDFIWNSMTDHEIFSRMTVNDSSENSFKNRSDSLKEKFFEYVIYGKFNPNNIISKEEKVLVTEIIYGSTEFYDILRMCYKDVIDNSNNATETIQEIIRQHTCFVQNGINAQLPLPVIKMCKGQLNTYDDCFGPNGREHFDIFIKNNSELLSRAECINSNVYYSQIDLIPKYRRDSTIETSTNEIDINYQTNINEESSISIETILTEVNIFNLSKPIKNFYNITEHISSEDQKDTSIGGMKAENLLLGNDNLINGTIPENHSKISRKYTGESYNSFDPTTIDTNKLSDYLAGGML